VCAAVCRDSRFTTGELRWFSYGNVFYERVRSGYTHECQTTASANPYTVVSEPAPVSYVNIIEPSENRTYCRIHFDVGWVADIVESVTSVVRSGTMQPLAKPENCWLDG
jgi:hypothetical protein